MSSAAISGWTSTPSFNRGNACSDMKFFISSISICIRRKSSARSGTILSASFFIPCLMSQFLSAGLKKMAATANAALGPRPISTTSDAIVVPASRNRVLIHGPGSFSGTIHGVGTPSRAYTAVKFLTHVTARVSS